MGDFPTVLLPGPRGMRGFPWTLQVRRVANRSLDSPRDPSGHRALVGYSFCRALGRYRTLPTLPHFSVGT
jgi:hypothetical protein